jgi:epoxyqueuosine reductase
LSTFSGTELTAMTGQIRAWGLDLGFQQVGIAPARLGQAEADLEAWLRAGYQGDMEWMARHGRRRTRPAELIPGTERIIMARMNYLPPETPTAHALLEEADKAYIARYSLGRDYHKLLRRRLQQLADRITLAFGEFGYRVFVDSGPVMEKPLAALAGLGWQGKHTNLLSRDAGSWFLLGAIYTDLPLPVDTPVSDHCGSCTACLDVCPTRAIVAPYRLDARRCISYLTIEQRGPIPEEFRTAIGNRIFGCDDCQLFCPWNKFAQPTIEQDFMPRHGLDAPALTALFRWDETTWRERTRGSALRRPGYLGWLRNLAIALGNAPSTAAVRDALMARVSHTSELVREHVQWALEQHAGRQD